MWSVFSSLLAAVAKMLLVLFCLLMLLWEFGRLVMNSLLAKLLEGFQSVLENAKSWTQDDDTSDKHTNEQQEDYGSARLSAVDRRGG
jgi:hypothetical protein